VESCPCFWRNGVAVTILTTGLGQLHAQWAPGLGWGAVGGLAYALAQFLADCREGFSTGPPGRLYLVQVVVRVILGAVVGAATLALGESAAFVSGLAGPAALVALGARFGRRKPRPGRKEAATNANDRPDAKPRS
jgi:hypothetical protein